MPGGFNHHEQSLAWWRCLERDGQGLNLTWEVRNGIMFHSKVREGIATEPEASRQPWRDRSSVSPTVWPISITTSRMPSGPGDRREPSPRARGERLGETGRDRINAMVVDIVDNCLSVADGGLRRLGSGARDPSEHRRCWSRWTSCESSCSVASLSVRLRPATG